MPFGKVTYWTDSEKKAFWRVIEKHGMDKAELVKAVPSRNMRQLFLYSQKQRELIRADPKHPKAHLLSKVSRGYFHHWSEEDFQALFEGLKAKVKAGYRTDHNGMRCAGKMEVYREWMKELSKKIKTKTQS